MTRRRVLFIEANEDGSVGGSHQVLYDMVRAMDKERFEPIILFYQDNRFAGLFRDAGVRVITWDALRAKERAIHQSGNRFAKLGVMWSALWSRHAFLKAEQIDLVHMNNSPRTGHDDWLPAARLLGIPIVASARGDADPLPGSGPRVRIHRFLMQRFDKVICVSEYIAGAMRAQGIPALKVRVVHDGVDRAKLAHVGKRSAAEIRRELLVPDDRVFVAAVGNIRSWKGQHVVLEGLIAMDPAVRAKLCVVFIGAVRDEDRDYKARLEAMVAEHGLADVVRFAGSRMDVPDILTIADIMVHSSTTPEPGGTVVIESMTFGTPVVVASKGGHLDYLEDGLGLVYDVTKPSDLAAHFTFLVEHPDERRRMAAGAKRRAAEFSIERTARKMEAEYAPLLR
ncbi:MAG: glycosyltransferase family 4 protein [Gemmatimonadaceae bacterium]